MQDIYNRLLSYTTLKGGIFPTTFVNYELVNYDLANLLSPTVLPWSPDPGDLGTYRLGNILINTLASVVQWTAYQFPKLMTPVRLWTGVLNGERAHEWCIFE